MVNLGFNVSLFLQTYPLVIIYNALDSKTKLYRWIM